MTSHPQQSVLLLSISSHPLHSQSPYETFLTSKIIVFSRRFTILTRKTLRSARAKRRKTRMKMIRTDFHHKTKSSPRSAKAIRRRTPTSSTQHSTMHNSLNLSLTRQKNIFKLLWITWNARSIMIAFVVRFCDPSILDLADWLFNMLSSFISDACSLHDSTVRSLKFTFTASDQFGFRSSSSRFSSFSRRAL